MIRGLCVPKVYIFFHRPYQSDFQQTILLPFAHFYMKASIREQITFIERPTLHGGVANFSVPRCPYGSSFSEHKVYKRRDDAWEKGCLTWSSNKLQQRPLTYPPCSPLSTCHDTGCEGPSANLQTGLSSFLSQALFTTVTSFLLLHGIPFTKYTAHY